MPDLPVSAQAGTTQVGGQDIAFAATPLDEAVRQISPRLGKAVHLSVHHNYRVTGKWKNASSLEILRDLAETYGLSLREMSFAYIIEDDARDFALQSASTKPVAPVQKTAAVPEAPVPAPQIAIGRPVAATTQMKEQARLTKELEAALRKRAELQRLAER